LVTLAYTSAEALLVTHVGKEAFIAVLSDCKLQLQVMKQEPQNVEAALSHSIRLEAFEQLLASQGGMVDHNDGRTTCRSCSVCTVAGLLLAGKTATLCKLIGDLQDALAQATRVRDGSHGQRALECSYRSIGDWMLCWLCPGPVSTPLALQAPGHMAFGQPSREGGCKRADHRRA